MQYSAVQQLAVPCLPYLPVPLPLTGPGLPSTFSSPSLSVALASLTSPNPCLSPAPASPSLSPAQAAVWLGYPTPRFVCFPSLSCCLGQEKYLRFFY